MNKHVFLSQLKQRINLEYQEKGDRDAYGDVDSSWTSYRENLHCKIEPKGMREIFVGQQDRQLITHVIYLRYNLELLKKLKTNLFRVAELNREDLADALAFYRVQASYIANSQCRYIKLMCTEGDYPSG